MLDDFLSVKRAEKMLGKMRLKAQQETKKPYALRAISPS